MLKFLHTADLHLGKSFHDYSLLEDQKHVLETLIGLLSDHSYSALIISGDVFDRSIPSPEAVTLFSSFLGDLKKTRPDLAVLIIPGNHDSPLRLGYGRELFTGLGIHIVSDPEDAFDPIYIKNDTESCACFLLPFLYPGSLRRNTDAGARTDAGADSEPLRTQAALAAEAALRLDAARAKALAGGADYTLLLAHLFCSGGRKSESERTFLGTAEEIDAALFGGFDYLALGHLHRKQKAAPNAWYSGSPLAYSFDEAGDEKFFLSIELGNELGVGSVDRTAAQGELFGSGVPIPQRCRVEAIPIEPLRPLVKLQGPFGYFLKDEDPLLQKVAGSFLEISLTGTGVVENPLPLLQRRFPFLLSVKQDEAFSAMNMDNGDPRFPAMPGGIGDGGTSSILEDFKEFLTGIYGNADEEKVAAFREILEDMKGGDI